MYLLKLYFVFCFIGFLFESFGAIFLGSNFNSSVLYGPWTTIYGIGIIIMLLLYKSLKKFKLKKWLEILIYFIVSAIILTLLEYLCGLFIYEKLHVIYWNYQNMNFRFNDFNCLEATLFWGFASSLIMYVIYPYLKKLINKIPNWLILVILFLYIIDVIYFFLN